MIAERQHLLPTEEHAHLEREQADAAESAFRDSGAYAVKHHKPLDMSLKIMDSDIANATRCANEHRGRIIWTPERGWLVWDGRRYAIDDIGQIIELAKQTARGIFTELVDAESPKRETALFKWARQSQGADRLRAMLFLTQSEPGIARHLAEFDADTMLLNVRNGTIDLRTGILRPHRREDLLSKITDIEYQPDADFKQWDAFLMKVLDSRPEVVRFLQRAVGYTLTGSTAAQVLFFLWGLGLNGKSLILELLRLLFGEYSQNASTDLIMLRPRGIPNDVARLAGARLVTISETADGQRLHEPLVKDMTGGDRLTARFLHREFFDFTPQFKLWMRGNHKPRIVGTDLGIWRRINLIPFTVTISERERIPFDELVDMLRAELPGILAWAVRGCLDWQRHGLMPPPEVAAATATYRREMDTIGEFLDDCCTLHANAQVSAGALYEGYQRWCEKSGHEPVSQTRFGLTLSERGFEKQRSPKTGRHVYLRLGLNSLNGLNLCIDSHPITRARYEENTNSGSNPSEPSDSYDT